MDTIDFTPTIRSVAAVLRGIGDDQLDRPTPCPAYTVGDLCDHVGGLTMAFTAGARKEPLGDGPAGDGSRLDDGWRDRVVAGLDELAEAWTDPAAYDGMATVGGLSMPGFVTAQVALNELVVHGWDLARSTGLAYDPDPISVDICAGFAAGFDAPTSDDGGPFGPPVAVPDDAPAVDRLIGLTGRDPSWMPGF